MHKGGLAKKAKMSIINVTEFYIIAKVLI